MNKISIQHIANEMANPQWQYPHRYFPGLSRLSVIWFSELLQYRLDFPSVTIHSSLKRILLVHVALPFVNMAHYCV